MRYDTRHAEATRTRILEACARQFRERGFGGVGVEALAHAANVTSGAFYNHFGSKAGAFAAVVKVGVERLGLGVEHFRVGRGPGWLPAFIAYYLGREHRADVAGSCLLPSLSGDVSRADAATREAYETELLAVAARIAEGLPGEPGRDAAWPILAALAGGVLLSRAVADPALSQEIADAVRKALQARETP
jgi:AcrR family transcriptional regulator